MRSTILNQGLSKKEVDKQIAAGRINVDNTAKTKSISDIIRENTLTLFNFINIILAILLIYAGSYKNLLFMVVVCVNSLIGIFQEIRAKFMIDKLSLVSAQNVEALRDGKIKKIKTDEIVLGDIICYSSGDQIASDGEIIEGFCEVNESLLTGEPNSIRKKLGDEILSGSFLISGNCKVLVKKVGKDNYSSKILKGVKSIKRSDSEIMATVKKIIKFISIAILPVSCLLFYKQLPLYNYNVKELIVGVSGAIIGMIPEGLVLLISTALVVSVIRLAERKVLVQDIYCIETLARVDTLCFDKTGTLTKGSFEITGIVPFEKSDSKDLIDDLTRLVQALDDSGETFQALNKKFNPENKKIECERQVLFSSEKKFSGATFANIGSYVIGAPEFVFKNNFNLISEKLKKYTDTYRVLVFAHSKEKFGENDELPKDLMPLGLILVKDEIRQGSKKIIEYFNRQGVGIKIISGDSADTVVKIAKSLDITNCEKYINLTSLKNNEEIFKIADEYTIFGRATPEQKQILLRALKKKGRVTAMVGDGVNDVLALKEADCSISFASGSDAARNISHLLLMNSNFSALPNVVSEGRRVINNIQRSSTLFLNKTIYSVILAILFVFLRVPYPFVPVQMSLMSALTIGIPSFFLAFAANHEKINDNLFGNILKYSLPGAIVTVMDVLMCAGLYKILNLDEVVYSTITLFVVACTSFFLLYRISLPLNLWRKMLIYTLIGGFFLAIIFYREFFSIADLNFWQSIVTLLLAYLSFEIFKKMPRWIKSIKRGFKRVLRRNDI